MATYCAILGNTPKKSATSYWTARVVYIFFSAAQRLGAATFSHLAQQLSGRPSAHGSYSSSAAPFYYSGRRAGCDNIDAVDCRPHRPLTRVRCLPIPVGKGLSPSTRKANLPATSSFNERNRLRQQNRRLRWRQRQTLAHPFVPVAGWYRATCHTATRLLARPNSTRQHACAASSLAHHLFHMPVILYHSLLCCISTG